MLFDIDNLVLSPIINPNEEINRTLRTHDRAIMSSGGPDIIIIAIERSNTILLAVIYDKIDLRIKYLFTN